MTERIDLDDLDAGESEEDAPNPGDWFWRGDGDPDDEPAVATDPKATDSGVSTGGAERSAPEPTETESANADPVPRVPRENEDRPAGIPMESGGAGAGAGAGADADESAAAADAASTTADEPSPGAGSASGPHGGGVDDMTLAFTYGAATRLSNFGAAAADAAGWADWVGIVGRVPAHVLNKFQRDRRVDLDFFNGSARGPGERLADIGPTSMFYAERMVVVGLEGEDEEVAEAADWEFVPLAEAAEKAGWEVDRDGNEGERADEGEGDRERSPE